MATNHLTGPVDACRTLVSVSTTFQAWVGAADAAGALASVIAHNIPIDPEDDPGRPAAMISNEGYAQSLDVGGAVGGTLAVTFEDWIEADEITQGSGGTDDGARVSDPGALLAAFQDKLQDIADEMMSAANQSGRLMVRKIERPDRCYTTPPADWGGNAVTVDNGSNPDRSVIPGAYVSGTLLVHYGFEG